MPKVEVDIDDKGEFVGQLPTELDAILTRIKSTAHGEGFGKGSQKAAEEAKQQIADAIKAEKLKLEAAMPLERQKFAEIEETNKLLKSQLETTLQESRKNMTTVSEAHALEITKRAEALTKRNQKIEGLVTANLRAMAAQAGARDESLGELEVILKHRIGFDDDMEPFVKSEDGTPAKTTAGNALPMDVFVKQYLDNHPHHRKPAPSRGGDARGGASLRHTAPVTTAQAARDRVEQGDRSIDAINDLFNATRKQPSGVN
jgi:hypothetical protein